MFELYLDSVDFSEISRLNDCLPLAGVTTNPSILANAKMGVNEALEQISKLIDGQPRFHVQVVSQTVKQMVAEAEKIDAMPYDCVIKIPASETGLATIKQLKKKDIPVLATAIYSVQQGIFAALNGADYLAPYVNRIDMMGANGINVVEQIQRFIHQHQLSCKLLPASFKNTLQVNEILSLGVQAITIAPDIAVKMLHHPAVNEAITQFDQDWNQVFGTKLSFES